MISQCMYVLFVVYSLVFSLFDSQVIELGYCVHTHTQWPALCEYNIAMETKHYYCSCSAPWKTGKGMWLLVHRTPGAVSWLHAVYTLVHTYTHTHTHNRCV